MLYDYFSIKHVIMEGYLVKTNNKYQKNTKKHQETYTFSLALCYNITKYFE